MKWLWLCSLLTLILATAAVSQAWVTIFKSDFSHLPSETHRSTACQPLQWRSTWYTLNFRSHEAIPSSFSRSHRPDLFAMSRDCTKAWFMVSPGSILRNSHYVLKGVFSSILTQHFTTAPISLLKPLVILSQEHLRYWSLLKFPV